jgi:hypothetical protein
MLTRTGGVKAYFIVNRGPVHNQQLTPTMVSKKTVETSDALLFYGVNE